MKKSIAKKWVRALRSGKFKQTTNSLRDKIGHCCLGVLCSISPYKNNYTKMKSSKDTVNSVLPEKVMQWADIGYRDPRINGVCLSSYNDQKSKSFEEIADLIEANYKEL